MAALLEAVFVILGRIGILLGLTQAVSGLLSSPTPNPQTAIIQREVQLVENSVTNDVFGLAALQLDIANLTTMVAALGTPAQAGSPVDISPSSTADLVDQIWNDPQTLLPTTPADALQQTARAVNTTGVFNPPLYAGMLQVNFINWVGNSIYVTSVSFPSVDPSTILPDDTQLTWATRNNPSWNVGQAWFPQTFVSFDPTDGTQVHWISIWDDSAFDRVKNFMYTPSSGPPERSVLGDTNKLLALIPLQYT